MKKKLLVLLLPLLLTLLIVGCSERLTPSAWMLGTAEVENPNVSGEDNAYALQGGVMVDKSFEFGIGTVGEVRSTKDRYWTGYCNLYLEPDPNGLPGQWYLCVQTPIDRADEGAWGPGVGVITDLKGLKVVTQYRYLRYDHALRAVRDGPDDEHVVSVGIVYRFNLKE